MLADVDGESYRCGPQRVLRRAAHADPDYKDRPSTAQILAAIDGFELTGDGGER